MNTPNTIIKVVSCKDYKIIDGSPNLFLILTFFYFSFLTVLYPIHFLIEFQDYSIRNLTFCLSKLFQEYQPKKSPIIFKSVSHSFVSNSMIPWTVIHQAPLSMEFSRQEYWSGLPFPSPGYLPDAGIKPGSPALQADSLPNETPWKTNYF